MALTSRAGGLPAESPPGYELICELGRGGMGVVFQARQIALDRVVAIKMILAGALAGPAERARFQAEAKAVAAFQHPHVVQVFETGEVGGNPYLVLEYCPSGLDRIARTGAISPDRAGELVEQIARGVGTAHRRGIIHRDLKPANVLLAEDGTPKVTDFGLVKRLDAADGPTATGAVMGTPAYMAPEQAAGKIRDVGPAADVYSLGAILYELLTGRPPFRADSVFDTLQLVLNAQPVAPRRINQAIPIDLETVVLKCLEKDSARRYPTANELADDLNRFRTGQPVTARRVSRAEWTARWAKRNRVVAGLTSLAVVLAVGLVVAVGMRNRPGPVDDQAPLPASGEPAAATPDDVFALIEDLDRTDPGWRTEEIERARRVVPPSENSAVAIEAALVVALPPDFEARHTRFVEANTYLAPNAPLPKDVLIDAEPGIPRIGKSRLAARQLADRPYGRTRVDWNRDVFSTLLPHAQRTRKAAALLQWDAVSMATAGNCNTALADCRGCINAGRALHDEPAAISQLVRIACGTLGVQTAGRVLALGEASDMELKAFADLVVEEEKAPILLIMARAERAGMHRIFTMAAAGDLPEPAGLSPEAAEIFKRMPKGPAARTSHVWAIRHLTRLAEIARLPMHQQAGPIREWEQSIKTDAPMGARAMLPAGGKLADACRRYQSLLRSGDAAVAAERYRMEKGRWPESLAVLVPGYLTAVPTDPDDGQPLRFRQLPDGLVVYGIGSDGKDDGGAIAPLGPGQPSADSGFRLWTADLRGKPTGP